MICLSLSHKFSDGLINLIKRHAKEADILEIRMDLLEDPEKIDFQRMVSIGPALIFTNRMAEEGGAFKGDERKRISLLEKAADAGADFIDIEYAARQELRAQLIKKSHRCGTKVILSFHDFKKTPDEKALERLFDNMADSGPDVIKIVTMANDPTDFMNFKPVFIKSRRSSIPVIAFCMGEKGKFSRICSLTMGGFLTFASPDSSSRTAPGQIPLGQMREILSLLQERHSP